MDTTTKTILEKIYKKNSIFNFDITANLSQEVHNIEVLKGFFPPLYHLSLPYVSKRLVPDLSSLQLCPKHITIRGNEIGQPLKQNIIAVNQ